MDLVKKSLNEFCNLKDAPVEDIEKLEQLRAIYHGKKITMLKVASTGFGIDTKEDLAKSYRNFSIALIP
jgi:CMP-2-keto-3-deoxyoctulosonic acid synthetase